MSIVSVKAAVAAWLGEIEEMGTVTTAALDSDGIPREARGARLWTLGTPSGHDERAGFGNPNQLSVIRDYDFALEGWHGFSNTDQITVEWETLVGRILEQLQASNLPPCRIGHSGIHGLANLAWEGLDVRIVRDGSSLYRSHHVRITFTLRVTENFLK